MNQDYDKDMFDRVIKRVVEFLCQKALYEKQVQGEKNQTLLGGILFWFEIEKIDSSTFIPKSLSFNLPPSVWDFMKILYDIDDNERTILINTGASIEY